MWSTIVGDRAPKAAALLADEVRRLIIAKQVPPGSRMPSEGQLIARTGLSRGTVREALRLLEADGLIVTKRGPGGGIFCRHPDVAQATRTLSMMLALSSATLGDLFEFRKLVEPAVAEIAARTATQDHRRQLAAAASAPRGLEGGIGFHQALAQCASNELMSIVLTAIIELVGLEVRDETLGVDDLTSARRAHRRVALAVEKGDAVGAKAAMLHHLAEFERKMGALGRLQEPIVPGWRWAASPNGSLEMLWRSFNALNRNGDDSSGSPERKVKKALADTTRR